MDEQGSGTKMDKLINELKDLLPFLGKLKNLDSKNLSIEWISFIQKLSHLADSFKNFLQVEIEVQVLTYDSAIEYFVENRPPESNVVKGAILRGTEARGQSIIQVFLDKENQLVCMPDGRPYGRKLIARKLDNELDEAFGNEDLIIVE
ncbi:hypothetical protein [Brasilonema sp. UFV-L1]|uniref:hypothetical protein n=1 Tax=Brasilonema sp. UFV-L1 TaxID=2234130 RepID=UPI00145D910A|nr:hypothetical protein [Brasilonema sp. UFV-L1]NMG09505.1 hypothetical protein [Brasilonema sp. UFV-L1]